MTELATCKTSVDYNVSLAKQAGLSLNWLQTQRDDCSHHKPNSSFAEVVNFIWKSIYRGSYMSAHVFLNLLNEFR